MPVEHLPTQGARASADTVLIKFTHTYIGLTLKRRETNGCVLNTVATDALVLKHQAISNHNANSAILQDLTHILQTWQ